MKYYEFVDKAPALGKLIVIEGVERLFSERAIATIVERLLEPGERDLNLDRFIATEVDSFRVVEAAISALPFLGNTRVVVVRGAHDLRADPRRALAEVAKRVPDGNTLIIEDLVSPASKRPEPLGKLLGRAVERIDTTPGSDARARFVAETLAELGARADAGAIAMLVRGETDLAGLRTDLEKLSLGDGTISIDDVERETLVTSDVKAYRFASAAVAGRTAEALALAAELFSADARSAAVPLLAALAAEYGIVWEMARPGGEIPSKARWRERELRAVAQRLGARRARIGLEGAVRGFEAVVTGRADDPRIEVELATVAGRA